MTIKVGILKSYFQILIQHYNLTLFAPKLKLSFLELNKKTDDFCSTYMHLKFS